VLHNEVTFHEASNCKLIVISNFVLNSLTILTAIFPCKPGLAGTGMSPLWILLELNVIEVLVTGGAIRCVKRQSNRHQQTNILSPNQQCHSTEGKGKHIL